MLPRTRTFSMDTLVRQSGLGEAPPLPVSTAHPVTFPDLGPRFRVIGLLGVGGMGTVWLVHDGQLEGEVALKVVNSPSTLAFVLLKNEFRRASLLVHPNVVQLYELFVEDNRAWFTMEHVVGVPLDDALRGLGAKGPLPVGQLMAFASAAAQVADGLMALHAHGILHRDVKPANILITGDGRAVLLDFGVAAPLVELGQNAENPAVAGTLLYMSPEALRGDAVPASDAFALGAALIEVLTGRTDLHGFGGQIEEELRVRMPWVPADLGHTLARMLSPDPAQRAGLEELSAAVRAILVDAPANVQQTIPRARFVGRQDPLARLNACWQLVRGGRASLVDLSAPSGMGKSELIRHFCAERAAAGALVLLGKCQPNENVPFRAFDDVLDRLARYLEELRSAGAAPLTVTGFEDLGRVFPSFGRVSLLAKAASPDHSSKTEDRVVIRASAFRALRQVLASLATTVDLVLAIDDFHWADDDSLSLLDALFASPAPRCLLVLVYRSEDAESSTISKLRRGALGHAVGPRESIVLEPLSAAECQELVLDAGAGAEDAARLSDESGGSPLFLAELLRGGGSGDVGLTTLDDLIARRTRRLPESEQALLAAVCVANVPTPLSWLLEATHLPTSARDVADRLVRRSLLRLTSTPEGLAVAPYHHRVAGAIVGCLSLLERGQWHGRLADAMRAPGRADAERLLRHLDAAGRSAEAAVQARAAAQDAEGRLAFHRAAELHALALDRGWAEQPTETRRQLADALAASGQAKKAAAVYRELMETSDLGAEQRVVARARAIGQDLNAGELARGLEGLLPFLRELGVRLPGSGALALVWSLGFRLLVAARGIKFQPVPEEQIPRLTRLKIDLLWSASTSLTLVDHQLADAAGARLAWEALRLGEPRRVARALAYKAGADAFLLGRRGHAQALALLNAATALASSHGTMSDQAYCNGVDGTVRWARGEWRESATAIDTFLSSGRLLIDVMPGGPTAVYGFLYSAVGHTGALRRLMTEVPPLLKAFERAEDRLGRSSCLLGQPSLAWLVADQPEVLAQKSTVLLAEWGTDRFLTQHYHGLITLTHLHLYRREPKRALDVLEEGWAGLTRSRILGIEVIKSEMWFLRGRAAAAVARQASGLERERALALLSQARMRVVSTRLPWSHSLTALLDAAAGELEHPERATAGLLTAADLAEGAGLPHLAAAARWRGGDARGLSWLSDQGAAAPEALAAALS